MPGKWRVILWQIAFYGQTAQLRSITLRLRMKLTKWQMKWQEMKQYLPGRKSSNVLGSIRTIRHGRLHINFGSLPVTSVWNKWQDYIQLKMRLKYKFHSFHSFLFCSPPQIHQFTIWRFESTAWHLKVHFYSFVCSLLHSDHLLLHLAPSLKA